MPEAQGPPATEETVLVQCCKRRGDQVSKEASTTSPLALAPSCCVLRNGRHGPAVQPRSGTGRTHQRFISNLHLDKRVPAHRHPTTEVARSPPCTPHSLPLHLHSRAECWSACSVQRSVSRETQRGWGQACSAAAGPPLTANSKRGGIWTSGRAPRSPRSAPSAWPLWQPLSVRSVAAALVFVFPPWPSPRF